MPWLVAFVGIFWIGVALENRGRVAEGRPRYSWNEARALVTPLAWLAAIMAIAYLIR
jgi:hypothetical protein